MEIKKIGITLNVDAKKFSAIKLEALEFRKIILKEFIKRKKESSFINKGDVGKNAYLAELFITKILDGRIDEEFDSENMTKEEIEKQKQTMRDPQLWVRIINYLFDNEAKSGLGYYVQTVNGAFKFYLSGKYQAFGNKGTGISAQDYILLKEIVLWKEYDAKCCFQLWLCKLYLYIYSNHNWSEKKESYIYSKFIDNFKKPPQIRSIVIATSAQLRGLLLDFESFLKTWPDIVDIDYIFNYKEFKKICEEKGVTFNKTFFVGKDLNDIVSEALYTFLNIPEE